MAETKRFGLIGFSVPMYDAQGVREYVAGVDDSNDQVIDDILARLDSNDEAVSALISDVALNVRLSEWTIVLDGQQTDSLFMYWNGEAWAPRSRNPAGNQKGDATSLSLSWTEGEDAGATFSANRESVNDPWVITPPEAVYGLWFDGNGWVPFVPDAGPAEFKGDANSTELEWEDFYDNDITATRSVLSYVLGSQTDKPLQPELSAPVRGSVTDIQTRIDQLSADANVDANVKALILGLYAAIGIVPTA